METLTEHAQFAIFTWKVPSPLCICDARIVTCSNDMSISVQCVDWLIVEAIQKSSGRFDQLILSRPPFFKYGFWIQVFPSENLIKNTNNVRIYWSQTESRLQSDGPRPWLPWSKDQNKALLRNKTCTTRVSGTGCCLHTQALAPIPSSPTDGQPFFKV